jgi:hypothetical protein
MLSIRKHASFFIAAGLMCVVLGAGIISNGTLFLGEFQVAATPPYPDLIISDLNGDNGQLFVTVENQGTLDMEAQEFSPYLYLYVDGEREWIYSYPMYSDISFVMAGTSYVFELEPVEGVHLLKVCIDPTDEIREQDEYNNCYEELTA